MRTWFKHILEWPQRSRFTRNVWHITLANVAAQALPVLAAPLLTRLYTPADFGTLAIFMSILSIVLAAGTARFDWSVPHARSQNSAAALIALGGIVLTVFTIVLALAWWLGRSLLPDSLQSLSTAGWLIPLALLGAGMQQLLHAWYIRCADLAPVGHAKITQSLATTIVSLCSAYLGLWGLIMGVLAGAWAGLGHLLRHTATLPRLLHRLNAQRIIIVGRRFYKEAAWSTLASVANTASFAVIPLMLARHFNAMEVGYYMLMQRVALGPISLIGGAVSQSFWAEAAHLVHNNAAALTRLYRRSIMRLAWISLPLALLALGGPFYVGPVFGDAQWAEAGWVLAASVPMLLGQTVASPLSHLTIHRKQHWQALWDVSRVILLMITIETLGNAGANLTLSVLGLSSIMGVLYVVLVFLNLQALTITERKI